MLGFSDFIQEGKNDKEAYQKFFKAALKKFGVSEPDELEGEKKKEFFDYVDANWESDDEEDEVDEKFKYVIRGKKKVKKIITTKAQKNKKMSSAKRKKVAKKAARSRKKNVGGQKKALRKRKKSIAKRKAFNMKDRKKTSAEMN